MSTFCEFGHHDVQSIREPGTNKLVHSVKACGGCTPAFLAKNLTVKEEDADAPAPRPE